MYQRGFENNQAYLVGTVATEMLYDHEVCGEAFYQFYLAVRRLSGQKDVIPLIISERLVDIQKNYRGRVVEIFGQFRSHSQRNAEGTRLQLKVFVYRFTVMEDSAQHQNEIQLEGFVAKGAQYRVTPHFREVSDILLAINRQYGKSDYIPCIVWGRNAMFATTLEVGSPLRVTGRIQSREYIKGTDSGISIKRRVYEVSVSIIECINRTPAEGAAETRLSVAEGDMPYHIKKKKTLRPEPKSGEAQEGQKEEKE